MSNVILPPEWRIREDKVTPETVFNNRRDFLKTLGFAGLGIAGALNASPAWATGKMIDVLARLSNGKWPAITSLKANASFTADRPISNEKSALTYNNFYEFTMVKEGVWKLMDRFKTQPWKVEVTGLVKNPAIYDIEELIRKMPVEERIYRHRCVETWAMVVPWAGFPLSELIKKVEPQSEANYVRFVSFHQPDAAPEQAKNPDLPWPYKEGLTIDEAMNELTFMVTGIYGHQLPPQHGAPLRLVTPWKYGFKSIKSITRIEFLETRPATFWNTLIPKEYGFESNVDPNIPHPRWSQRREKMIGTGEVYATQKYNGYGKWVADLYE